METEKIVVTRLLFDETLYPREQVNATVVNRYADAMRAGAEFPPILVARKGWVILDGVKRWRASRKVHGDGYEIACLVVETADEKEMYLESIRANAAHGEQLTGFERRKCVLEGERRGISRKEMAEALGITPLAVDKLVDLRTASHADEVIALKPSMTPFRGGELNAAQMKANKHVGAYKLLTYVNHLKLLLRAGALNRANEGAISAAAELYELLGSALKGKRRKAS